MARLLVNKHFTEHDKASQGFSNHEDYVFGEIIICNDSSNPSIYIKDADRNSVAIGNVRITNDDNLLSKTDSGEIKTTIGLSWDSQYNKIKLIGVNDTVISEINVFGDNTIGDRIDESIDRIIDVNVIIPTELNHPAGTIIGKEYLEIIFSVNGNETIEYIPFVSSETLFTIEGGVSKVEGEVVAEFDKEGNKYVISHGVVDVENNDEMGMGSFGNTKYITDINVNEFGHVTSINKSTLPEIPEHKIKKVGSESQAGYYVEDVLPTTNDLEYEVKYKELPKPSITTGETITDSFTTTFVSNIVANGKDTHLTYELSKVNFDGYAKMGDLDKFVDEDELNAKLVNLGLINPDGEVPEVQVTIDDSEVLEGKYVYDIDVDDTDKTKMYIRTRDLGLDKFITKDSVVNNDDSVLAWGESVNIAEVGGNGISATLPSKPGVSLSEEETSSENGYVVIDVQPINEGETNEIKIIKKELVLDGIVYDKNIDVPSNGTVLEWPNAENTNSVSVAKIGNKDIKIKLPSQPSIEVNDIENISELTKVITDIQAQGHVLNVTKSDINLKDYVDKESVISEDKELPWKTKDAKGVVIPTKIAEIGGKSINVIMPDEPVINYVSGSTTSLNPKVVTDIKVDGLKMTVNYEDAIPKDYVSIEELNNKHFLTANNVNVKNGSTDNNTKTFVKSITTGITDNELDITLSYGNIPEYDINDDITYTSTAQLKWGDEEGGKDGVSVVKIGDKDIKVKLPNDPKVNDVVNSKIVTYDIDSVLTDKKLNIKLTPTQNGIEGTSINTDADFSDFVKTSEIPDVTVVDNGSGKFVTDVTSNGHSITLTRGDAMQDVDVESSSSTVLQWNTAVEIAKVDGKSIYAKLPVEPEKGEGADGNTLYTIEGGLTDKSLKITLKGTDTSTDEVTADFSDFVKTSEIPDVTVVDNGSGKFVTDVTSNGHSITLTRGDAMQDVDVESSSSTVLQWNTAVEIAKVDGKSIYAKLPVEPEKGEGADGNTLYTIEGGLTDKSLKITLKGTDTSTDEVTADFSDFVKTSEIPDVTVVDNGSGKFVTDVTSNGHSITLTRGDAMQDVDVESSSSTVLQWNTAVEIAKVDGKSIYAKLPVEPEKGEGADGNTLYTIEGGLTDKSLKITLKGTDTSTDEVTADFSDFVKTSEIPDVTVVDNGSGKFVTDVTSNGHSITLTRGDAMQDVDVESSSSTVLQWNTAVEIAKVDGKSIYAKLPVEPEKGEGADGNTLYTIEGGLTDKSLKITLKGTDTSTDEVTADFSDFVKTSEIPDVTVVDNGSGKFVTDVTSNGHSITLTRGDAMQDVDVESSSSTVLQWNTAVEIAKVDGKSIYAKLPVEPEKGEGADGNTLYTIEGGLNDKSLKITLKGSDTSTDEVTADFSDFVKTSEIPDVTVVDNGSGKFVTDVTSNGHSITLTRENVDLGDYVKNADLKDYIFTQGQHYTPTQSASTKSANNGQYISGIKIDNKNHIIDVVGTDLPTTATTADSAKALSSTISLGGETQPVYFKNGSPVVCKTFITGISKTDVTTALGYTPLEGETYKGTVTDVKTIVGNSTSVSNAATTNGSTYLRTIVEGSDGVSSSVLIQGTQNIGVTSDSNGTITITGPNLSGYITSEDTVKYAQNAGTVNNLTVATAVPANAVFTDTATTKDGHYNPGSTATTMSAGSGKYISSLSLDGKGHVTGTTAGNLPTFSESFKGTVTSVTVQGSDGLTGSGTVNSSGTITLSHDVVYSGASLSAGDGKYISSLSLDGKGHVTGTTAGDLPTDTNYYHTPQYSKGLKIAIGNSVDDMYVPAATTEQAGAVLLAKSWSGTSTSLIVPQNGITSAITFALDKASDLANDAYTDAVSAAETAANDAYTAALGALDDYAVKYADLPVNYGVELNAETKAIRLSLYESNTNQSNGKWTTSSSTISPLIAAITPKTLTYYPVSVSYDGYLACYVPWKNTDCTYDGHYTPSTGNSPSWVGTSITGGTASHLKGIQIDGKGHVISGAVSKTNYVTSSVLQPTSTTKNYLLGTEVTGATAGTEALKHNSVYTQGSSAGTVTLYATQFSGLTFSANTGFYETSDERHKNFKDDIEVDFEKLKLVPKKYFTWKDEDSKKLEIGTSAQEIQKIYPEIVNSNTEGVLSVDYSKLSVIALKAIDVLHDENEKLRKELDEIKKHLGLK